MRLVGLILDKKTDPAMLPNALFLISTIAADPGLKEHFGQIMAIERILDLVRNIYRNKEVHISDIVGNSCLTLANLCFMHVPNTTRFNRHRGTELIVEVLNWRGDLNDERGVNGCSAVICNLCFKNEGMKETFGSKNACEALVQVRIRVL